MVYVSIISTALSDPKAYLARLRQEVNGVLYHRGKNFAKGEQLPDDWPVSGTAGEIYRLAGGGVGADDEQIDNLRFRLT